MKETGTERDIWDHPYVTREQIEALQAEAGVAGDLEMVEICRCALSEDDVAWSACAWVIHEAKMGEE